MGKGSYKDHFGNAVGQMERTLRDKTIPKDKVRMELLPYAEQVKIQQQWVLDEKQRILDEREAERIKNEKPRFSGCPDRKGYLAAQEILKQKAAGTWIDPEKEAKRLARAEATKKKEYVPKDVTILSAFYGIKDIKVIDITDKILVNEKVTNVMVGEDPCPKKKKNVYVKAIVDGIETEVEFIEGKLIRF